MGKRREKNVQYPVHYVEVTFAKKSEMRDVPESFPFFHTYTAVIIFLFRSPCPLTAVTGLSFVSSPSSPIL